MWHLLITQAAAFSFIDGRLKLSPPPSEWKQSIYDRKDDHKLPVVLSHGMGDACSSPEFTFLVKRMVQDLDRPVYCIGDYIDDNDDPFAFFEDVWNGFFGNLNAAVNYFAMNVEKIPELKDGFHVMGFSQGNQILRGYIERYNSPPVKSFVSVHGPLMGIGGFPACDPRFTTCSYLFKYVSKVAYTSALQALSFQADYIRNPLLIDDYLEYGQYLPDLNNEIDDDHRHKQGDKETYKKNFTSLDKLVLVKADQEITVMPPESEWFGFYEDGQYEKVLKMEDSRWYKEDLFGLKTLNEANKIVFLSTVSGHCDLNQDEYSELLKYF